MRKYLIFLFILINLVSRDAAGAEVNEEELFSSPETMFDESKVKKDDKGEESGATTGYSAQVNAVEQVTRPKGGGDDLLSSYILGQFFLDARLRKKTKYFANLEVLNSAQSQETDIALRESFIDFSIKDAVYFRTGKQVLQWGRAFLWNPSDLINVEKKPFINKIGSREGTYGIRIHIPSGTSYNLYGFIDLNDVRSTNKTGMAYKYEFIAKGSEMAFSLWHKQGFKPVYAYDLSTRLLGWDTVLETAISRGASTGTAGVRNGLLFVDKKEGEWIPRASLDFGKQFDLFEVNDRVFLNLEFYYNHAGDTNDTLTDDTLYQTGIPGMPLMTRRDFLFAGNLYEPNYFARYYAALFSTVNKFIISDLSLNVNLISNLNDNSHIASTGITYTDTINDYNIGIENYFYIGRENREYTLSDSLLTTRVKLEIIF